jgi:hypothetical protein
MKKIFWQNFSADKQLQGPKFQIYRTDIYTIYQVADFLPGRPHHNANVIKAPFGPAERTKNVHVSNVLTVTQMS